MDLEDLKKKKIGDLRYIGQMLGLKSMTKMSKQELIEAILSSENNEHEAAAEAKEIITKDLPEETEQNTEKIKQEKPKTKLKSKIKSKEKKREHEKTHDEQEQQKEIVQPTEHLQEEKHSDIAQVKRSRKNTAGSRRKKENNSEDSKNNDKIIKSEQNENINEEQHEVSNDIINESTVNSEKKEESKPQDNTEEVDGLLEILSEGYGFLRVGRYMSGSKDIYVPPTLIRKFSLKTGDRIHGRSRMQRENDKYNALCYINTINDDSIDVAMKRKPFESLTPIYPDSKIKLETVKDELSTRIIDLIAPIGKGQRGMIVSPPKAGKTVLLKKIANAISENYPDIHLILLLIDERPEEVTDMRESVKGEVISSTFDEMPEKHIKVSEMVFERAKRLVEHGRDVVILMDSLTRLARAYNITIAPTGRSLSGGLDPGALYNPKRFFGAARNIRGGGSLTIVATALIDTGSKMDDVIFEEFKGTGNMELHLDRKLSEKRIFPAMDINKSGTRKEELLLSEKELNSVFAIRRAMSNLGTGDVTEMIVSKMIKTNNNEEFIKTINISQGSI